MTGVLRGESPDLLGRIRDPSVQLVIWERSLQAELGRWIEALPPHRLPDGRVLAAKAELPAALAVLFEASGTPDGPLRLALMKDVTALASAFMVTAASDVIDVRLEAIQHDACWKFHRDCVSIRLLTTYRGPGTEWVPSDHAAAALAHQQSYRGPIEGFPRHGVGLFKGSCTGPEKGIVHRSPPIAGTGTTRLLLCLNLPSPSSPALWSCG